MLPALFKIIFYIAICRFIGERCDRPGAERLSRPKNNLRIRMRLALVLSRKIQVNVRLFVPVKP